MKSIDYVMLGLGAISIALAAAEWMGKVQLRVEPRAMILIAVLFVGRVVLRLKMQGRERQREMMLREVPKRPLGLEDNDAERRL